jgi:heat shock protein HslJ
MPGMLRTRRSALPIGLIVAGCVALGCAGTPSIEGTHWQAIEIVGQAPVAGSEPTLQLGPDRVSGSGGCNDYATTSLVIEGERILMGGLGAPDRPCPDPRVMAVEEAYFRMLLNVDRIGFRSGLLVLSGTGGELVFRQVPGPER